MDSKLDPSLGNTIRLTYACDVDMQKTMTMHEMRKANLGMYYKTLQLQDYYLLIHGILRMSVVFALVPTNKQSILCELPMLIFNTEGKSYILEDF